MKPTTGDYLDAAAKSLASAHLVLGVGLPDQAGRLAYYAMFHAAQALIFEKDNRTVKTHGGVDRVFRKLALQEASLSPDLHSLLNKSYQLKSIADYAIGQSSVVSSSTAAMAIADATRFVMQVRQLVTSGPSP